MQQRDVILCGGAFWTCGAFLEFGWPLALLQVLGHVQWRPSLSSLPLGWVFHLTAAVAQLYRASHRQQ